MPPIVASCSMPGCQAPAKYKLGAPWSDGRVQELKNYGLACDDHLAPLFQTAEGRRAEYKAAPGETVDEIHIYQYSPGQLDKQHPRLVELERSCRSSVSGRS